MAMSNDTLQDLDEIRRYPTVIDKVHESVYRSFRVLRLVSTLLEKGVPGDVVLDVILLCDAAPHIEIKNVTEWNEHMDKAGS